MDELPIVKRLGTGANLLREEYGLYGHARDQEQAAALIRAQHEALVEAKAVLLGCRDCFDSIPEGRLGNHDSRINRQLARAESAVEEIRAALAKVREG